MIHRRSLIIHTCQTLQQCQKILRPSNYSPFHYSTTSALSAMKPGTKIAGLDSIFPKPDPKKGDVTEDKAPVAKPREEYPHWVSQLTEPLPTLGKLKSMKMEDATDRDMKRYLKLVRRAKIKETNNVASG